MSAPADKVVLSCAVITLGSTVAASLLPESAGGKGKLPSPRLLIGTSLTYIGLSMTADFAPQLAAPLAITLATTAAIYYGIPIIDNYFNGAHNPIGFSATRKVRK
jgi:hypothetical protein